MDQALNVDRYLTARLDVVRRLLDAEVPPGAAERWVAAWEAEAERRGLDPAAREWWRSGREWIAQACGGPDPAGRSLPEAGDAGPTTGAAAPWGTIVEGPSQPANEWRSGPFAQSTDRVERQVLALAEWLRSAMELGARNEEEMLIHVMDAIHRSSDVIAAFRAWLGARSRYQASDPSAPDHDWLRCEMERLCAAYEAAVGEAHGP
ncbi:MAG: hypothetical protein ACRDGI_08890 [Candidatus Limnocylindrales bacterium]